MKNRLVLSKTYDYCGTKNPKLTVVLIHGIASDSHTYDKALGYFHEIDKLKPIRFVTFDLLGSGESLKNDELNYDYDDQIEALHNSIKELKSKAPLILIGHSLGTFIVTRYTSIYPNDVSKLVLISAPIYTEDDFDNPLFALGIEAFKKSVSTRNPHILQEKAFNNSMDKIVMDRNNYAVLANLKTQITIIYGDEDQLIASYNIPAVLKDNPHIAAIKTHGRHGVSADKYHELAEILTGELDVKNI